MQIKSRRQSIGSVRAVFAVAVAAVTALPARADTAPPFTTAFGRLIVPEAAAGDTATSPTADMPAGPETPLSFVGDPAARHAALDCLALAITYEAGHEPVAGQAAVAQVILNRVAHPRFSQGPSATSSIRVPVGVPAASFSFRLRRVRLHGGAVPRIWAQAQAIAAAVLDGRRDPAVGTATFYHADYVSPYWAPALVRMTTVGAHIFYRFPGQMPTAAASGAAMPAAPAFAPWGLAPPSAAIPGPM